MITDRQRAILHTVWPQDKPFPSDEKIDRAYSRWQQERKQDRSMTDFYFDFGMALATYTPMMWLDLFSDEYKSPFEFEMTDYSGS